MSLKEFLVALAANLIAGGIIGYFKGPNAFLISISIGFVLLLVAYFMRSNPPHSVHEDKQIAVRLADLMREELEIRRRLESATNDNEYIKGSSDAMGWISRIVVLLNDAELFTDAVAFSEIGNLPQSAEQVQEWRHIPDEPRRRQLIRLAMYRKKLDQIMSNRRL